ncbi:MAG: recombination protein NinG [Lachnospiraceae bacterium]
MVDYSSWGLKTCAVCGKEFEPIHHRQIFCSNECKKSRRNEQARRYNAKSKAEKLKNENKETLHESRFEELTAEARSRGISYGMLQAEKYMKRGTYGR